MTVSSGLTRILTVFLFLSVAGMTQYPPFAFKRFTIDDGLSQSSVGRVYEDRLGFIWIATEDGVNRYDGKSFKIYRHNPSNPNSIMASWIGGFVEDKSGNLWMLPFQGGLTMYLREKDHFRNFPLPVGSPSNDMRYDEKNDRIWFTTRNQLYSFSFAENRFKAMLPRNESFQTRLILKGNTGWVINSTGLYKIDLDKNLCVKVRTGIPDLDSEVPGKYFSIDLADNGTVYVGSANTLYSYDPATGRGHKYTSIRTTNNGVIDFSNLEGVHPVNQSGKYLWLSTNSNGMIRINEDDSTDVVHYYNSPGVQRKYAISDNRIHYPSEGKDSIFWVTSDDGINYYDEELDRFVWRYHDEGQIKNSKVNSYYFAYTDRIGNAWLSTRLDGVSMIPKDKGFQDVFWLYDYLIRDLQISLDRYYENLLKIETSLHGVTVRDILEDSAGDLWICTDSRVIRYINKTGNIEIFLPGEGNYSFPAKSPGDIIEDKNDAIWFLPFDGRAAKLNGEKTTFTPISKPPQLVNASSFAYAGYFDKKGRFWIGDGGFILRFEPETGEWTDLRAMDIFINQSARFWHEQSDSILWIGATDKLIRHNYNAGTYREVFLKYANSPAGTIHPLMCQAIDQAGNIWVGTYGGGIVKYNTTSGEMKNYRTGNGLSNDYILELQFDKGGTLWASTNDGLSRLDPETGTFRRFNTGDGTVSREFNSGASLLHSSGIMIMGGTVGLTAFRPEQIVEDDTPPGVVFTKFLKFNEEVKLTPDIQVAKEVEVEYSDNLLSFEFSALNFSNPDSSKFVFKLEGFHENWIQNGSRREVHFTNLDPGEYVLKIIAANSEGEWSREPAAINLRVLPPFYMTWWFRSIVILLAGSVVYGLYLMKVNQIRAIDELKIMQQRKALEQEKRIKTEISRNLHDEVNTELTQLANVCRQLSRIESIPDKNKAELGELHLLALKVRQLIDDVIWFIQPENMSNERMVDKLVATVSSMLKYIDYEIEIADDLFEIPAGVDIHVKKHIYLILKESLQNIIKHSGASQAGVTMKRENDTLRISISDNGTGFDKSARSSGSGLGNIHARLKEIGGKMVIATEPGNGTNLQIVIELGT